MLHIEVVQLVAVGGSSVSLSVSSNKIELLSCPGLAVDSSRGAKVGRELFVKLPSSHDLVFHLCVDGSKEEGTATLSAEYLSGVASSVHQVKVIHLKPLSAGVKIKMDFVVPKFDEAASSKAAGGSVADSQQGLQARYDVVFAHLAERRAVDPPLLVMSALDTTDLKASRVTQRRKNSVKRVSIGRNRVSRANSAENAAEGGQQMGAPGEKLVAAKWKAEKETTPLPCVAKLLVHVGSPVKRGTPLVQVELGGDAVGEEKEEAKEEEEEEELTGYVPEPKSNYMATPDLPTGKYLTPQSVGYSAVAVENSPPPGRAPAKSPKRLKKKRSKRSLLKAQKKASEKSLVIKEEEPEEVGLKEYVIVCWEEDSVGCVSSFSVREETLLFPGDVLLQVDVSTKAEQLAYLAMADEAARRSRQERKALDPKEGFSINSRFQVLAERLSSSVAEGRITDAENTLHVCTELERVVRDFFETARRYGQVIVSEIHLPVEEKTLRPISTMGGVLGGSKYLIRGILFKVANGALFESYEDPMHIAGKVQGHELKGLRAYFNWFFNQGLLGSAAAFPLACLIDYRGFRVIAMTELPISGASSLIYGSADASEECFVKDDVPSFSDFVRQASEGLNLASHWVIDGRTQKGEVKMSSCVDLEGHRGSDGRHYLLDFSRTFPCCSVSEGAEADRCYNLYKMMRPEAVARWSHRLCADAFSGFMSHWTKDRHQEARSHNDQVRAATNWIMTEGVVRAAQALDSSSDVAPSIALMLHKNGVNMRYLGLVYSQIVSSGMFKQEKSNIYTLIQCEALMRVLKGRLRSALRGINSSGNESASLGVSAKILNDFFGAKPSLTSWLEANPFVIPLLQRDFSFNAQAAQHCVSVLFHKRTVLVRDVFGRLVKGVAKLVVLSRLNQVVGLGLSMKLLDELAITTAESKLPGARSFDQKTVFEDLDISYEPRIKNLDLVDRVVAIKHFLKASAEGFASIEPLLRAYSCLEHALDANPSDQFLMTLTGHVSLALCDHEGLAGGGKGFQQKAELCYKTVAGEQPNSAIAQFNYGVLLAYMGNPEEAELRLLRALELFTQDNRVLDLESLVPELVLVLDKLGKTSLAQRLKELVQQPSTASSATLLSTAAAVDGHGDDMGRSSMSLAQIKAVSPREGGPSVLEGYLLKQKKTGKSDKRKKRWMTLDAGQKTLSYSEGKQSKVLGTLSLVGATAALNGGQDALTLVLSSGAVYVFGPVEDSAPLQKWHDALESAIRAANKPTVESHRSSRMISAVTKNYLW